MRKKAAEIENRIENELMSISKSIYLSKDLGHLSGKFANELTNNPKNNKRLGFEMIKRVDCKGAVRVEKRLMAKIETSLI